MSMNVRMMTPHTLLIFLGCLLSSCSTDEQTVSPPDEPSVEGYFYLGADLSYVNQIMDKGGVYQNNGIIESPYKTFATQGANLARFRLWHSPIWTKEVYGDEGIQLYNDLDDVERSIASVKNEGMEVLLDFHYSDTWADPGKQYIPSAWKEITDISVLSDSVYNYTYETLAYLGNKGLMPEFVQIGNETNCGMLYTQASSSFPNCNVCDDNWANLREVIQSAIDAIREVDQEFAIETKIILHIANPSPSNVNWWYGTLEETGQVKDYDIIGLSYYPIWHKSDISLSQLENALADYRTTFGKPVMIMETAYPWTLDNNDEYNNLFGNEPINGYPITMEGHKSIIKDITQAVYNSGNLGVIYWEPSWIASDLKDLWGTGSSWENCAFYDYDGNANGGFDFLSTDYSKD